MIAREAYRNVAHAICRKHYDAPPSWAPAMGPVEDSRHTGCEVCHVTTIGRDVSGGRPGTEDYDEGRVIAVDGDQVTVAWDSGVSTTQRADALRPLNSMI